MPGYFQASAILTFLDRANFALRACAKRIGYIVNLAATNSSRIAACSRIRVM